MHPDQLRDYQSSAARMIGGEPVKPRIVAAKRCYSAATECGTCSFSACSRAWMSPSIFCTWLEKTYCAGRWFCMSIYGAIAPVVRTPMRPTFIAFHGLVMASTTAVAS